MKNDHFSVKIVSLDDGTNDTLARTEHELEKLMNDGYKIEFHSGGPSDAGYRRGLWTLIKKTTSFERPEPMPVPGTGRTVI